MYSEGTYKSLPTHSLPAIVTARLDTVILQIKLLAGSNMDPRCFGFVDAPPVDALSAAMEGLQAAGALDAREALLPLGHALAMLPVDVHIGKLLVRIPCRRCLFVGLHGTRCIIQLGQPSQR